jgi:hypothetical protein
MIDYDTGGVIILNNTIICDREIKWFKYFRKIHMVFLVFGGVEFHGTGSYSGRPTVTVSSLG